MELAPLFLLLLLPPADATGEMAGALEASLRSELGDVTMALAPDRLVTPAMLEGDNPPYRARFMAHVTWTGKDKASIEVRSGREAKTVMPYRASRVVTFSHRDRKAERGRAIGLVIAGLLRDSPPAVTGVAPLPRVKPPGRGLMLAAVLSVQRARTGDWPVGPVFSFTAPLADAFGLQVSAGALASGDTWQLPFAVLGNWRFLRSQDDRHALALGLGAIMLRESSSPNAGDDDDGGKASLWNVGGVASLSGYVSLGRSLRLLAQVEGHALARKMTVRYGEDEDPVKTLEFSRWRPTFGLGLAYSM